MAKGKSSGVNKSALVREAMDALGMNAKPAAIDAYIKEKHNVEVSKAVISSYKSSYKSKQGKGKPGRKAAGGGGGLQVADLAVVRGLVARLGAAQVKELVDVLG